MPAKAVTVKAIFEAIPTVPSYTYDIIEGADSSWKKASDKGIKIVIDGDFARLENVSVNGKTLIRDADYTAVEGSVIVTLLPTYLEALAPGEYAITFGFGAMGAETTFSVLGTTGGVLPQTGVNSHAALLYAAILLLVSGILGTMYVKKRHLAK